MEAYADILYEMGIDSAALGTLSMILSVALVAGVIGMVVSLVLYILQAVGIHTIAKRRGIRGGWLAWIPIAQYWAAGAISDQYKTTVKGKTSHNRIIMLVLALVSCVLSGAAGTTILSGVIRTLTATVSEDLQAMSRAITMLSASSLLSVLGSIVSITLFVFWQISLYDIYASSCPKHSVLFLVLGIFFSFTVPFFLFCNRRKDDGMRIPRPIDPPAFDSYDSYRY